MEKISQFEQIAVDVVDDIRSGRLSPGDMLPTVDEWKQRYGVSYGTVRQARLLLKRKNYIERGGRRLHVTSIAPFL